VIIYKGEWDDYLKGKGNKMRKEMKCVLNEIFPTWGRFKNK
jgi:hypothetical protein